jgi:hypothetical protein
MFNYILHKQLLIKKKSITLVYIIYNISTLNNVNFSCCYYYNIIIINNNMMLLLVQHHYHQLGFHQ